MQVKFFKLLFEAMLRNFHVPGLVRVAIGKAGAVNQASRAA